MIAAMSVSECFCGVGAAWLARVCWCFAGVVGWVVVVGNSVLAAAAADADCARAAFAATVAALAATAAANAAACAAACCTAAAAAGRCDLLDLVEADFEDALEAELTRGRLVGGRLIGEEDALLVLLDLPDGPPPLPPAFSSSRFLLSCRRRIVEFQWFLTELSVRPGNSFAISAHLFPNVACASRIIRSSSCVHGSFLMPGCKWLCHRSRHCLPIRPFKCPAINDHRFGPYLLTSSILENGKWGGGDGVGGVGE